MPDIGLIVVDRLVASKAGSRVVRFGLKQPCMLQRSLPDVEARHPAFFRTLVVLACVGIDAAARALIEPLVEGAPFVTFFPAVAATAYFAGLRAGAGAVVLGEILALYFWIPPVGSFGFEFSSLFTVAVYVLLSAMILALIHRPRVALSWANAAEATSRLYAREMAHLSCNLISLVQAVASMTFKDADCMEEQRRLFGERLVALGKALAAPVEDKGARDVYLLPKAVLLPFGERIRILGRPVAVTAETAASLALVYHELATNAVKYGALNTENGSVHLVGTTEGEDLVLEWRETGGPAVDPSPERKGFGGRLLRRALSDEAGAVDVRFAPEGLVARVTIKPSRLTATHEAGVGRPATARIGSPQRTH